VSAPAAGWTRSRAALAVWGVALVLALAAPWLLGPFPTRVLQQILLFGGLAIAWSMLGGFTQYWSFGHTAFVGLGAFAAALLEQRLDPSMTGAAKMLLGTIAATSLGALVAALLAIPILRLRGIYFAVAMLAVAEIMGEASKNFDLFQGAMGLSLPAVSVPGLTKVQLFYYLFLAFLVLCAVLFALVARSRFGTGLTCIGQDEDTAAMLGVPTERYKTIAFVSSAALATLGGALYAHSLGFITTGSVFRIDISFNMILFAMIGGIGTVLGPILGATIMIVVTQVLLGELLDFHMLLTGVLLIAIVLIAPKGLLGLAARARLRLRKGREGAAA
jgi:branched-chain amino acid transport system permease protein